MQCFGAADRRQLFDFSTRWRWRQDARCSSHGKRILIESVLEVPVIPAYNQATWIPAFAGMTVYQAT